MKNILFLAACFLLLWGCKTQKPVRAIPINTIERVIERMVPVEIPADSAVLTALFECDSLNNIRLIELHELKTKRVESSVNVGHDRVIYRIKTVRDTVYLKADSVYIEREKPVPAPYPVEKELNWWQKTRMHIGLLTLLAAALLIGLKVVKRIYGIK